MRALLPISHGSKWEVEPRRKLFLRQIQPRAQRPYRRHAASARELRLGRGRRIGVGYGAPSSLMASKARQSDFGGFFGLSLNLVILSFFMWLRSSGGYDANDVASHRIGDEKHSAVDQSDGVETQLARGIDVIELEHVRIQEHFRVRSKARSS